MEINITNKELLDDLWNFHLVLFGTGIAIFTLLYSFIISKRDDLRLLADQIKQGAKDPILTQRESFARIYITKLHTVNRHSILLTIASFVLFISDWATKVFVIDALYNVKWTITVVLSCLTLILVLYLIILFIVIFKHYFANVKV